MSVPEIRFGFVGVSDVSRTAEVALRLEALGFDAMGMGEHVMLGDPPTETHMGLPVLAAAAGATRRIRLVSAITLLPLYHPVLLAKLVTTMDRISSGRFTLGIGAGGDSAADFRSMNVAVEERGARCTEALGLLRRLWTEEEVTHEGKFYHCDRVTLRPRPVQQPHPPVWVAGRQPAAMRRAARLGEGWLPYMYSPAKYRESITTIREAAANAGRDLADFAWGYDVYVMMAATQEEAMRAAIASFGYRSSRDPASIIRDYWLVGTPAQVVKGVEEIIAAGAREIFFTTRYVGQDPDLETARLLAAEVLPHFRSKPAVSR